MCRCRRYPCHRLLALLLVDLVDADAAVQQAAGRLLLTADSICEACVVLQAADEYRHEGLDP
jgi:hypothetical protein